MSQKDKEQGVVSKRGKSRLIIVEATQKQTGKWKTRENADKKFQTVGRDSNLQSMMYVRVILMYTNTLLLSLDHKRSEFHSFALCKVGRSTMDYRTSHPSPSTQGQQLVTMLLHVKMNSVPEGKI